MPESKPFFSGETSDRKAAFPGILALEMTVEQDQSGYYAEKASQQKRSYTLETIPRHLACLNPRFQQGGLDLQNTARYRSNGTHFISCRGHLGSPAGRRKGDDCDNAFVVTLHKTEEGK